MNNSMDPQQLEQTLQSLFGHDTRCETSLGPSGAGVRFTGIDLCNPLSESQADFLFDALAHYRLVCIAGQDLGHFSLVHFERFANHWGAVIPHPNNFTRGGKPAQGDGDSDGSIEFLPFKDRRVAASNLTFPNELQCLPHESPTVLLTSNFSGPAGDGEVKIGGGGSWHSDIEYEPLPIYVSMFLAHHMPTARTAPGGTWMPEPDVTDPAPYYEDSPAELLRLRKTLPLNAETPFADTAAAFSALAAEEQAELETVQVRRRLNEGDEGWLAPLVRTNSRSGLKSLHSPIWASRPRVRPAIEVDGMSMEESRVFLDRLEAHVLQPQFRYDHLHVPGDVTIWDNYMTLHNTPPLKANISSLDDARLLYRLSCKGDPVPSLPRQDRQDWLDEHIPGGYSTPVDMIRELG